MSSEKITPTVSPDQGATGETTTSSENKEAGMQTGLSEEEQEARLLKDYDNTLLEMLNIIKSRDPEAYWDRIIDTLFKHFARENKSKRFEKPDFLNLDKFRSSGDRAFGDLRQCARWSRRRNEVGSRRGRI